MPKLNRPKPRDRLELHSGPSLQWMLLRQSNGGCSLPGLLPCQRSGLSGPRAKKPPISLRGELRAPCLPVIAGFPAVRFLRFVDLFSWFSGWVSEFNLLKVVSTFRRGSENGQPSFIPTQAFALFGNGY